MFRIAGYVFELAVAALGNGQFKSGFDQLVPKFSDAGKLPQHMAG